MNKINKIKIIYSLTFFIILILFFHLSDILTPFFLGILIAYLLNPFVDWLEEKNITRSLGTFFILLLFFLIILTFSLLIIPILLSQIVNFFNEFPEIIKEFNLQIKLLKNFIRNKVNFLNFDEFVGNISPSMTKPISNFLNSIITSSFALFNLISLILITPLVSWYLLKDWNVVLKSILKITSKKYKNIIYNYAKNIDDILNSYIRGQLLVSSFLSLFYFFSFYILNLNYSLFLGLFVGFFSFIPIVGILFSLLIISILTYLQYFELIYLVYLLVIFLIGQLLESNLLTPKLIGKKLGLHPLIVILSIFVFGALFGIIGIIFAIPLTSIITLILKKNLFDK